MKKEYEEKLKEITEYKTPLGVICLTIEECSELIKELCKYNRSVIGDAILRQALNITRYKLMEEIADVEIMLEQLKGILNIKQRDIENIKEEKILRTYEYMLKTRKLYNYRKALGEQENGR